jgi:biopolymer transport protein ExbB/TolQ
MNMYSVLSLDRKTHWDHEGAVRSIRILAQGIFVLFLILWGCRWWSRFDIPLGRYIQAIYVMLFLMAWCVVRGMIERSLTYGAARNQSRTFARQVAQALRDHNLDQAITIAGRYRMCPYANVVASGLASFQATRQLLTDAEVIETTQRALKRSATHVHGEMKRGLGHLASIASTAPLVGAYGTVMGIYRSFGGGALAQSTWIAVIAEGLADALLLTALSLLLGVLTVWCYRYLHREVEALDLEMENESVKTLNYLVVYLRQQK